MSKFTEVPYIEKVLSELSGENKAILLNYINGRNADNTAAISYSLKNMTEIVALTAGVTPITYRYSSRIHWRGYIIKTTNYRCFLTFKTGIDLVDADLYDVSSGNLLHKDKVSADTIRALLREDAYVDVSELPEAGTSVEANPELAGTEGTLTALQIGDTKYAIGGGGDDDVTVEIENTYTSSDYDNRTDYAAPISLKDFIDNCEAGVYTNPGIIARISNLIGNNTYRIILLGTDHDKLAKQNSDSYKAKTTWQFLECPLNKVAGGFPTVLVDFGATSSIATLSSILNGTNASDVYQYPTNRGGYATATGLLDACHTVFESLPDLLKRHIKTVSKVCRMYKYQTKYSANGGSISITGQDNIMNLNMFLLSATELKLTTYTYPTEGTAYALFNKSGGSSYRQRWSSDKAWGAICWTRSAYWMSQYTEATMNTTAWAFTERANQSTTGMSVMANYSIAPAFCI